MGCRRARFDARIRALARSRHLVGLDEVGRGALAGPVVVAGVVLPPGVELDVRDSKQMTEAAREAAFVRIRETALAWAALAVSVPEVDRRNVLGASLWGMEQVLARLRLAPDFALVDGHMLPAALGVPARCVVKGDDRSQSIAAASVMAKVARDRLMRAWHRRHPEYGFDHNVGYPTPDHLRALRRHGVTTLHRHSFAPVAQAAYQGRLFEDEALS